MIIQTTVNYIFFFVCLQNYQWQVFPVEQEYFGEEPDVSETPDQNAANDINPQNDLDDGANGPGDNTEAIDMDNIEIDAMNVSDEKTFLITKRKMILKKIQQDFKAQKSYEVHR